MQKEERVIDKQDIVKDQHTSLLGRKDLFSLLRPFFSFHSYKKNYQLRFNNFSQGSKGNMELKNTNPEAPAHIHTHALTHAHIHHFCTPSANQTPQRAQRMQGGNRSTSVQTGNQKLLSIRFLLSATLQIHQSSVPKELPERAPCDFSTLFSKWNLIYLPSPIPPTNCKNQKLLISRMVLASKMESFTCTISITLQLQRQNSQTTSILLKELNGVAYQHQFSFSLNYKIQISMLTICSEAC